jgi:chromosome segregation ATPase
VTNSCVRGSSLYEEELPMETTETKNTIQTAAREATESARKAGGKLQALAGSTADASKRWARRCGEMLSGGARLATLQANQRVLRTKLDRAHREVGRAVHAVYGKEGEASPFAEAPQVRAALDQVKEIEEKLNANSAKVAEIRQAGNRRDSTPS